MALFHFVYLFWALLGGAFFSGQWDARALQACAGAEQTAWRVARAMRRGDAGIAAQASAGALAHVRAQVGLLSAVGDGAQDWAITVPTTPLIVVGLLDCEFSFGAQYA